MLTRSETPSTALTNPPASPATRRRVLAAALALGAGIALATPLTAGTAVAASSTCLNGTLAFDHNDAEAGTHKPLVTQRARNSNWELWGRRTASGQVERLSGGLTGATDGRFSACYNGPAALRDVHVRFFSSTGDLWRVVGAGTAKPGDPNWKKPDAVHLHHRDAEHAARHHRTRYRQGPQGHAAGMEDHRHPEPALLEARHHLPLLDRPPDLHLRSADGRLAAGRLQRRLLGPPLLPWRHQRRHRLGRAQGRRPRLEAPDSPRGGHWFQWQLHNKQWPPVRDCNGHTLDKGASAACGWTEGFANAVAAYALGDTRYTFSNGASYDLLDQRVVGSWGKGDWVEGRVAAALLELWGPSGPDGGNWNRTLKLMNSYVSSDFKQYFTQHRPLTGLSTTGVAKTIINRNTIVY